MMELKHLNVQQDMIGIYYKIKKMKMKQLLKEKMEK